MASRTAYSTWTSQKPTLFSGHYLRNHSTLDKGVLGYIGIVRHKEHSPEVLSISPGTPCIWKQTFYYQIKTKVKFTLEKAIKTKRGSRDVALFFLEPKC